MSAAGKTPSGPAAQPGARHPSPRARRRRGASRRIRKSVSAACGLPVQPRRLFRALAGNVGRPGGGGGEGRLGEVGGRACRSRVCGWGRARELGIGTVWGKGRFAESPPWGLAGASESDCRPVRLPSARPHTQAQCGPPALPRGDADSPETCRVIRVYSESTPSLRRVIRVYSESSESTRRELARKRSTGSGADPDCTAQVESCTPGGRSRPACGPTP